MNDEPTVKDLAAAIDELRKRVQELEDEKKPVKVCRPAGDEFCLSPEKPPCAFYYETKPGNDVIALHGIPSRIARYCD